MTNLFSKAACFTDIHFGKKANSVIYNQDCLDFVDWFIETAKKNNCETCIFLGDFFDSRSNINVNTLNFGIKALEKLGKSFNQTYILAGNHDLYYRDRRDINSIEFADRFHGVTIVKDLLTIGNVSLVPWLVNDEYKKIPKLRSKYIFGHFELPRFLMNAMIRMPESNTLQDEDFKQAEYVFSGHFHKRQFRRNIIYIGNTFPMNYADAWDDERGMMMLEWGKEPEFGAWPDAPKYRTIKLSQLLDNPDHFLKPKTYARIMLDIEVSYEEANYIKETFLEKYQIRELSLLPDKNKDNLDNENAELDIEFESVDTIVTKQLNNIESEFYDPSLLLEIYQQLK